MHKSLRCGCIFVEPKTTSQAKCYTYWMYVQLKFFEMSCLEKRTSVSNCTIMLLKNYKFGMGKNHVQLFHSKKT